MSEMEYLSLVRNAASEWLHIKRALTFHHPKAIEAEIEDAFEAALIIFSDRKKILNIKNPEKPFRWLLHTAERMLERDRKKKHGNISIEELETEPFENDDNLERVEAEGAAGTMFSMMSEGYANILKLKRDGYSFDEIAEREGKPIKAIYNRYERAKIQAIEIGIALELLPPPQQ